MLQISLRGEAKLGRREKLRKDLNHLDHVETEVRAKDPFELDGYRHRGVERLPLIDAPLEQAPCGQQLLGIVLDDIAHEDIGVELLAKPLNEILADREHFKESAAAWDAFGAMWMLSQRAMKRVALDLAAQLGVSEDEVVARALVHANEVLNGDGVDLGGLIAEAQLAHVARHKPLLRKQFR